MVKTMVREADAGQRIESMMQVSPAMAWLRGVAGAVAGGAAGYYVFMWLRSQGYYGLAMPAILLGLGFGICAGRSMILGGLFCVIGGLALMIFCEWSTSPFVKDESFKFFLENIFNLQPVTLISMALGMAGAFWFGKGH